MRSQRRMAVVALAAALPAACSGDSSTRTAAPTTAGSTIVTTVSSSTTGPDGTGLQLDLRGLGPVRVGMTLEAAARALGRPLNPVTAPTDECTLYAPATGFDGLAFLVAGGTVARAEVTAGPTTTAEGMAIGQTEAEAQKHYGNRLRVTPHDFALGGHYLTLVPTAPADAGFRMVAETDGARVTGMRAGRLPEVELTEGCS